MSKYQYLKKLNMTKTYFSGLAAYNSWANNKVISWLDRIDESQWTKISISSFSSVESTVLHIASAEKVWIDFWNNKNEPVYLSAGFTGSKEELIQIWKNASAGLEQILNQIPEEEYRRLISFKYPRGGEGQMEFWQTFSHIINHSTYHRGQLVSLLRQSDFTELSSIDLATYYILVP